MTDYSSIKIEKDNRSIKVEDMEENKIRSQAVASEVNVDLHEGLRNRRSINWPVFKEEDEEVERLFVSEDEGPVIKKVKVESRSQHPSEQHSSAANTGEALTVSRLAQQHSATASVAFQKSLFGQIPATAPASAGTNAATAQYVIQAKTTLKRKSIVQNNQTAQSCPVDQVKPLAEVKRMNQVTVDIDIKIRELRKEVVIEAKSKEEIIKEVDKITVQVKELNIRKKAYLSDAKIQEEKIADLKEKIMKLKKLKEDLKENAAILGHK